MKPALPFARQRQLTRATLSSIYVADGMLLRGATMPSESLQIRPLGQGRLGLGRTLRYHLPLNYELVTAADLEFEVYVVHQMLLEARYVAF